MPLKSSAAESIGATRAAFGARLLRRWRSLPVLVRAATGGFIGLMLGMMYLYPVNYGFDETAHFDMAYAYSQGQGPYAPGHRIVAAGVQTQENLSSRGFPPAVRFADLPNQPRPDRKSIAANGGDASSKPPTVNQMVQHPPLYYLLGAAILDVPGVSSLHADIQFTLLRLLSLLLMVPIPWLCYATAKRLGVGAVAPSAALVPLLLPSLARSGASVTNDSLMNLTACVVLYLVTKVVTGDRSPRTAWWIGGWVLASLLTKGFALILPLIVVLAYLVCWRRTGEAVVRQLAIVCGASVLGGIWWLNNLIAYGTVQPDGGAGAAQKVYQIMHPGPQRGTFRGFIGSFFEHLTERFWGSIGLIETPSYNTMFVIIATTLTLGLITGALIRGLGGTAGRAAIAVPLLMLPLTVVLLIQGSFPTYKRYVLLAGVQGRYLQPGLTIIAAVAILGLSLIPGRQWQRAVPLVLVLVALYAQAWTVRAVFHEWWFTARPVSSWTAWRGALHVMLDWSPWPFGVSIVIAAIIAGLLGNLVVTAVRVTRNTTLRPLAASNRTASQPMPVSD